MGFLILRTSGGTDDGPLSLPLVDSNTPLFTYLGTFDQPAANAFGYGGSGLSVDSGKLYCSGLQNGGATFGQMSIPSIGAEATTLITPVSVPSDINQDASSSHTIVTGSLAYGSFLYLTLGIFYDATGAQDGFLVRCNKNLTGFGTPCTANGDAGSADSLFSGQMGIVPEIWRSLLGGPAFIAGMHGGLGIVSQSCNGFGFSTFDPDAVTPGSPVALTEWLNYPYVHTLFGRTATNAKGGDDLISDYDGSPGCAFIPAGSRSLLFLRSHTFGAHSGAGTSPCDTSASGSNDTPTGDDLPYRRMQVIAYDLADVIANKNASNPVWTLLPYAWWEFPDWRAIWGNCPIDAGAGGYRGTMTYDEATAKLYVSDGLGDAGKIYVFDVAAVS